MGSFSAYVFEQGLNEGLEQGKDTMLIRQICYVVSKYAPEYDCVRIYDELSKIKVKAQS